MKKLGVIAATLVGATMLSVAPISVGQSLDKGLSLAIKRCASRGGATANGRECCWCPQETRATGSPAVRSGRDLPSVLK